MDFKGTKGKWKISITPDYHVLKCSKAEILSELNSNYWIAKVQNNGLIEKQEGDANALLISKAPEMLEMLIEVSKHHQGGHSEIGYKIKRLIKEATEL